VKRSINCKKLNYKLEALKLFSLRITISLIVSLFSLNSIIVFGQEFGGNQPSMKWNQINTDTVRVIFPESMYDQAQRVANTVHYLNKNTRRSIGDRQHKIDIVLQNQPIISNGYVGLAPFRSELYMNAPQNGFDLGSNWLDLLSIHEYRHALQFMNTRQGVTNFVRQCRRHLPERGQRLEAAHLPLH